MSRFFSLINNDGSEFVPESGKRYKVLRDGTFIEDTTGEYTNEEMIIVGKGDIRSIEALERNVTVLQQTKADATEIQPIVDAIQNQGLIQGLQHTITQANSFIIGDWAAVDATGTFVKPDVDNDNVIGLVVAASSSEFRVASVGRTEVSTIFPDGSNIFLNEDGSISSTDRSTGFVKKLGYVVDGKVVVQVGESQYINDNALTSVPLSIKTNIQNQYADSIPTSDFLSVQWMVTVSHANWRYSAIVHVLHDGAEGIPVYKLESNVVSELYSGLSPESNKPSIIVEAVTIDGVEHIGIRFDRVIEGLVKVRKVVN